MSSEHNARKRKGLTQPDNRKTKKQKTNNNQTLASFGFTTSKDNNNNHYVGMNHNHNKHKTISNNNSSLKSTLLPAPPSSFTHNNIPKCKDDYLLKLIAKSEPNLQQRSDKQIYEESKMNVDINALTQFFQNECNKENNQSNDDKHEEKCNKGLNEVENSQVDNDELDLQLDVNHVITDTKTFVDTFFS